MTQGTAWAAGLLAAGVCAAPDAGDEGPNASKAPRFTFPQTLEGQEAALAENPLLEPFRESRAAMAGAPHRPVYHYVNPEHVLNDPNGLCFWQGRWRLFYQAYPPEDPRQHWGHAVSDDLFHWRDLPYAIHPGPERMCFSGATFVEEDRVIALYHGVGAGTMAAVSSDPQLLTWDKVAGGPVIPEPKPGESLPYNVFDPCVWKQGGRYYALTAGSKPGPGGKSVRAEFLHLSSDLAEWQYLSRASAWRNTGSSSTAPTDPTYADRKQRSRAVRPTSRRQFLRQTGAALGAAAAAPWAFGQAGDGQAPNVLFIAIDDLNDWAGCLGGHPQARTPNIDRLANEGCLFSNAFTSSPACGPSRTSALTGLLPSTTGVYGQPIPFRAVLPHAVPLPDHFRANGYHAMQMGKMFHMYQWWSWDEHLGFGPPALPEDRPLHGVPGLPERVDWGPVEVEDNEMRDGRIADWAIERLQRDYDQPFFLAPGFMKPHTPFYAPPEYFDMFPLEDIVLPEVKPDDLEDIPEAGRNMRFAQMDALIREHGAYPEAVQGYLAATAYMDAQLGRVLDALDASPHADNTVVMLWSDHGFNLGEKHTFSKFNIWEEACRVPLVIKAPGVTTPGTVCTRPVSLIDLYPTLVELTGVREQAPLDGASLVPLLKDPDLAWEQPALTTMFRGNHSLRTERWRYIRYADGSEELYDMENDPMCWDNLAKDPQYDEVKAKLARWLPAKDAEAIPAVDRETYTEWQQEWREHMQWRREWDERLRGGGPVE